MNTRTGGRGGLFPTPTKIDVAPPSPFVEQLPVVRSIKGEKARADDLELHYSERIVPLEVTSTPIFDDTG